ncbi:MAG: ArsR family transcriptional regulator [Candidatus Thermoplasmatota archaeon]|jgi:predicted ArsR family transcriptional regulator|nr:ArsR family transcriptional regulator [Candidatus Thermoplasmatota archaeon]MCL5984500.1 ArsR family transcriptional regulator [Candidatus Thermoplasmatota archaeon]
MGEGTKAKILHDLLDGGKSARELARTLKIRESAIRMHLERMVEMGLLSSRFQREGVGRPKKKFYLTSTGHEMFTRRYDLVMDALLGTLMEKEGDAYVRTLFTQMGRKLADTLGDSVKVAGTNGRTNSKPEALVQLMNGMGEKAELIRTPTSVSVVNHNCIFRSYAMKYPGLFCDSYHKAFVERLMGQNKVVVRETMAKGAPACILLLERTEKA